MGLLKMKVAEIIVEFYDEKKDSLKPSNVYISYWTNRSSMKEYATHFINYASKISNNLGNSIGNQRLAEVLRICFSDGINKETNLLNGVNYKLIMVEKRSVYTKRYQGLVYDNNTIKTPCSIGQEDYFAPMSVIVFLQYFINNLSESNLEQFNIELMKMIR